MQRNQDFTQVFFTWKFEIQINFQIVQVGHIDR
jgi:hypothetical protein